MVDRPLLLVLSLCLAGCSGPSGGGGLLSGSGDSLDVYEAVFRHQLKGFGDDAEPFLSIDGRDVPAALLERLCADWPKVRQLSEGEKGKILHVYAQGLKWEGTKTAVVKAGNTFPTKYAAQTHFGDHHLIRKDGKWAVEKVTNEAIGCG